MTSFYTDSTCSDACWYAREDVCHCMCNGANHGIYRNSGNTGLVERTMRIKSKRYKLYAVSGRLDAYEIQRAFYVYNRDTSFPDVQWWNHPAGDVQIRRASESQILNWPEIKPFFTQLEKLRAEGAQLVMGDVEPYLIWIPVELTSEWLDEHPISYQPYHERMKRLANNSSISYQ